MTPTKQSEGGFSKFGICDPSIGYTVVNGKPRVFEPNDEYKGDLARVYFYMATCYEAYKTNAGKDRSPLDWDKSDKTMLDGTIYPFFKEWAIKMLLRWAIEDPVSEKEINRNAAIFDIQKNRNPFVDYPGLEQYIWGSNTEAVFSYDNYVKPDMTGISEIYMTAPVDDAIYNLRGQRVNHPKKGVYIRRGQKFVVK